MDAPLVNGPCKLLRHIPEGNKKHKETYITFAVRYIQGERIAKNSKLKASKLC